MAPRVSFWLLLIAIIHCGTVFPTANAEKAFVRPSTSVPCPSQPCLTFNEYAQEVNQYSNFVDNTTFLFLPGTHELDARLDLKNLSNISFVPSDEDNTHNDRSTVQILLSPSVNITWTNCDNVEVSGLVFILSGQNNFQSDVDIPSTELIFQKTTCFLTNLTLIGNGTRLFAFSNSSSHIQISNLVVTSTKAQTLVAYDSTIDFFGQNIFFNNNVNVILYFASCSCDFSGNISFVSNTGTMIVAHDGANYISGNVLFVNNINTGAIHFMNGMSNISGNISFVNNTASDQVGGQIQLSGATCYIPGNISFLQNVIKLTDTEVGRIRGGAAIFTCNSTLIISGKATFVCNRAIGGGAIHATFQSRISFEESSTILFTENSATSFIENSATSFGGAISIDGSNLTMYGIVLFERNSAGYGGGAIAIYSSGVGIQPMINCNGRSITFRNNTAGRYGGAIYASNGANIELRDILFKRNTAVMDGGAVYVDDSSINMTGTLHLVQNSAQQGSGGAMAFIYASSKLLLTEPLTANFVENSATVSGGAIFFEDNNSARQSCITIVERFQIGSPPNCFIELSSKHNIRLNFDNNAADVAGRIFYGGNLNICRILVGGTPDFAPLETITLISNLNDNYNNYKNNTTSNVSSDPLQVCICKGDGLICDNLQMEAVRGREFILRAVIVGQGQGAVPSAVRISLDNSVQLSSAFQRIQNTGKTCTNISYSLLAESNTTEITLFPDNGPCRDFGIGRTLITVTFLPCPNAFVQTGFECVCVQRLQSFNALCNISDGSIKWSSGNMFWMGALYDNDSTYKGLILHRGCPLDYCVATPVPITLDNLDIQCNNNHFGILCGSCKENYSIAFGTLHCLPCSNNYLALILPFALAGIALVAVVLFLRLTVTAGTLNGLTFYASIIQANRSIFFPGEVTNILTVFIAWLNLDLGIETCFYDGMTTYVYTWLQFVFPFYVWFLIGLIIVATHYSSKLTKLFGKNPVATLSTLLLISYSKILRTIISSLSFTTLEVPDGNNIVVWLYDGSVGYTGNSSYLVLAVFSTLILLFLFIPYTLLLFCTHWLQALSHWRILSWLNKIKPFMDTYHAPYKKQTRYWTGLLLFVRLFLFAFDAINSDSELILIITTSVTAVLAALAYVHKGIYENHFNGILEAFFIANLCFFAAVTYHIKTSCAAGVSQDRVAHIFVGLAFVAFICIILFHIYMILRETALWKKIPKFSNVKKYFLHGKEENNNTTPDDRQQSFNLKAPTTTVVELREPLLDQ